MKKKPNKIAHIVGSAYMWVFIIIIIYHDYYYLLLGYLPEFEVNLMPLLNIESK